MPIKIPDNLPARRILDQEGVPLIRENDAMRQDIRPVRIALLNLMPEKIKTETQIARVVGSTPLQVELSLLTTATYTPTNTSAEHMLAFYKPWTEVADETFDGLIITGAPVEEIDFEAVDYWTELTEIFEWARANVSRSYNICWGGQAALYHFYGVPKYAMESKLSGVFDHRVVTPNSSLLRGFADSFRVPVSRYTETRRSDIDAVPGLAVLAESDQAGLCLIEDRNLNQIYMFNHLEYDSDTLASEYHRDVKAGRTDVHVPDNYFPDDDPARPPINSWRAHGHLLFANWISEIYQHTSFDMVETGRGRDQPTGASPARKTAGA